MSQGPEDSENEIAELIMTSTRKGNFLEQEISQ